MPKSTSSQKSRVRAGKRTLLERRRRFGAQRNAMKLPLPPPLTMSELIVKYGEGALGADVAHPESAHEKARGEADRSVHAPLHGAGAAEDDDDYDLLIVGRPILRKNVSPLTDSKGGVEVGDAAMGKGGPMATSPTVQKLKRGIEELEADFSAAAQELLLSKVEADKMAARLKAQSAQEESIESQIRLLENQVLIPNANAITSLDLPLLMKRWSPL